MHDFKTLVTQFEGRIAQIPALSRSPESLYEPCRYLLGLGGKRIRPVLCLMAAELFAEISEDAWQAALAIELFHNFTLVHDDIMDHAPLRRGQATIHARNGLTAGILCGDVLCIAAYQHLGQIRNTLPTILAIFNQTALEVCEGQQLDMDFESKTQVSVADYVNMIGLKTSVLLAASLKIGAIIGGTSAGNAEKIYELGKALGIAFQLQDDYLDAFGDPIKTGKQAGGDILANKKTFLYLHALENCDEATRTSLHQLNNLPDNEKVAATTALFRATGADRACTHAVVTYSEKAFAALDDLACTANRKAPLKKLVESLLHRQF
ncbi:MAG: polyprenyl synthetase family protein [Bacteroidetes bacterium]|nr:polyprenyl synthetase family protein [Bacteroidota bacterium]